jgi:hypothetical protein
VCVETNDGGEEVVALLRATIGAVPSEDEIRARLAEETGLPAARLGGVARRIRADWARIQVETISRRSSKTARFAWYGETAARGQQAIAPLTWLDSARHWSSAIAQGTGFEPKREGQTGNANRRDKKDRFDAWCAAAQVLLGVRETTRGIDTRTPAGPGWMSRANPAALR